VDRVRSLQKPPTQLRLENLCVKAQVRLVLHRHSCSNETLRNQLEYEFWVQWNGSGAFIAKNSAATSFSEFVC
jgi:hypothetical protein